MPSLCIALDTEREKAINLARELKSYPVILKVGYKLFIPHGVGIIEDLKRENPKAKLFLDLKLHDIPNTVRNGVLGANQLGVNYLTIHSLGGEEMIKKAAEVKGNVKLLGVTLLTSHDEGYLRFLGIDTPKEEFVLKLADMATSAGCDGLVCSAEEVEFLKKNLKRDFIAVVPGIRLEKIEGDDQKRVATPEEAVERGADIIVVGRPILRAENPIKVVEEILKRIGY